MPYRIEIRGAPSDVLERLVHLGALDVEAVHDGIAAILPDGVPQQSVAGTLSVDRVAISDAVARDNGSVWLLSPRSVRIGSVVITSTEAAASPNVLRLVESDAFGSGHHPTTALCVEALEEILSCEPVDSMLDLGTGSGILALTALMMGVPKALGLDIDSAALQVAAENARLNHFTERLQLALGGPDAVDGTWSLVVANVLAAPLMDMAPVLVRRMGTRGRIILSGIPSSLQSEVMRRYQHFGIRHFESKTRNGWSMLMAQASW